MKQKILLLSDTDKKFDLLVNSFLKKNVNFSILDPWNTQSTNSVPPYNLTNELLLNNTEQYIEQYKTIIKNTAPDYIVPTWSDYLIMLHAETTRWSLSKDTSRCFKSKSTYYKILNQAGVLVPSWTIVESNKLKYLDNLNFPVIVKPPGWTGSCGVEIVNNYLELQSYPHGTHVDPDPFSLVQEYISGTTLSINGHIYNGVVHIDLIHKIESGPPPFRVETGMVYPSGFDSLKEKIISDLYKFCKLIEFDNSPFRINAVVNNNGDCYWVDFSPRIDSDIELILLLLGYPDYTYHLTNKLLNNVDLPPMEISQSLIIRYFDPDKTGTVTEVCYVSDNSIVQLTLPKIGTKKIQFTNNIERNEFDSFVAIKNITLAQCESIWDQIKSCITIR